MKRTLFARVQAHVRATTSRAAVYLDSLRLLRASRSLQGVATLEVPAKVSSRRSREFNGVAFLVEVLSLVLLAVLSVRTYLFGNGYYEYADQYWSVIPGGASSFVSYDSMGGFVFTRAIVSWPIYLFFSLPSVLAEKATILYLLGVYFAILYITVSFARSAVERYLNTKFGILRRLCFFYPATFLIFSNLENIDLFVDGGIVTDGTILLLMLLSSLIIVFDFDKKYYVAGALLSLSLLLDPDYFLMFVGIVLGWWLVIAVPRRLSLEMVRKLTIVLMSSVPSLVFMLLEIHFQTGQYLTNSTGLRAFSPQEALFMSSNLSPASVITLTGHWWSTVTFAPPSIIAFSGPSIGTLPTKGNPVYMVYTPDMISSWWYFSLFAPFLFSVGSTLFRRVKRITLPGIILMMFAMMSALYARIPPLLSLADFLVSLPLAGTFISTTLSVPGHFLMLVAVLYDFLGIVFLACMLTTPWPKFTVSVCRRGETAPLSHIHLMVSLQAPHSSKKGYKNVVAPALLITAIIVFGGWQSINGDFYPARAGAFQPVLQNGLVDSAPFSPRQMPPCEVKAYEYLHSEPGAFNIYWPALSWPNGQGWVPPDPEAPLPGFSETLASNLSEDAMYFLESSQVRFLVLDGYANASLATSFGHYSYKTVNQQLMSFSFLTQVVSCGSVKVFKVNSAPINGYDSDMLLRLQTPSDLPVMYALLRSSGYLPAFVSEENVPAIALQNSSANIDVLPPSALGLLIGKTYELNSSVVTRVSILNGFSNVQNFTLTNWGGQLSTFVIYGKHLNISGNGSSVSSISLLGNMVNSPGGYATPSVSGLYNLSVSFSITKSINVSEAVVSFFAWNGTSSHQIGSTTITGQGVQGDHVFSISSLGSEFHYLTARLNVVGSNYAVAIDNLSYDLVSYQLHSSLPFGYGVSLNGSAGLPQPVGHRVFSTLLQGTGIVNGLQVSTREPEWVSGNASSQLVLSGNFSIEAVTWSTGPYSTFVKPGLLWYEYSPVLVSTRSSGGVIYPEATIDSMAVYLGTNVSPSSLTEIHQGPMLLLYIGCSVQILATVVVVPLYRKGFGMVR